MGCDIGRNQNLGRKGGFGGGAGGKGEGCGTGRGWVELPNAGVEFAVTWVAI